VTITIHWWTIPALLTVLSIVYIAWPSKAGSVWNELAAGVLCLCILSVNLAAWLIGALLK